MNYRETEEYLFGRRQLGMKFGLERAEMLLEAAGDPQLSFRTIHIVGTNGKGSTTAMLSEMFLHLGFRVGRMTSPHLLHFRERAAVDNRWITEDAVVRFVETYREAIEEFGATFFEVTTVMSAWYFRECGVEFVAAEAGLGGRLDATKLMAGECTVFTGVELEHRRILGATEALISAEKVAIAGAGTTLIAYRQAPDVEDVIERAVRAGSLDRLVPEPAPVAPIPGAHQRRNAGLALAAVLSCSGCTAGQVHDAFGRMCSTLRWAGRLDLREGTPRILFDVAHTPGSIAILAEHLKGMGRRLPLPAVLGFLEDKMWREMVRQLRGVLEPVVATTPLDERCLPAETLAAELTEVGIRAVREPDIGEALRMARSLATDLVVVTGSFFVVGEAMNQAWMNGWIRLPERGAEQEQVLDTFPLVDTPLGTQV
jgi:dihydrofolate synthase / folylpolyglutamate synthase